METMTLYETAEQLRRLNEENKQLRAMLAEAEELLRWAFWANHKQQEAELALRARIDKILRYTEEVKNNG